MQVNSISSNTNINILNSKGEVVGSITGSSFDTSHTATFTLQNEYKLKDSTGTDVTASANIGVNLASTAKAGDTFSIEVSAATAPTATFAGADLKEGNYKLVVSDYDGTAKTATLTLQDENGKAVKDKDGNVYKVNVTNTDTKESEIAGIKLAIGSITGNSTSNFEITTASKTSVTLKDSVGNAATGIKFEFNDTVENGDTFTVEVDAERAMKFQIGANEGQNTSLAINDMGTKSLGLTDAEGKGLVDLTSQATADTAITTVDNAISKVSSERAKLGAVQNRLEHTINNLGTSSENLSAAESRIRDVDMAKEMMEFTKNNILSQASQSMLAQANQQPQSVLQLLQ